MSGLATTAQPAALPDASGGDLMTPAQLADEWQVSAKTLANWRSARIGPPYEKLGGSVRYSRKAVAAWRAEQPGMGGGVA